MPPQYFYEFTEDAQYEDITERVRLYTLDVRQNAESGSVALSSIFVDDPDGNYDIVGWRRVYIRESTATGSNQVIYNGYTAIRTVDRGPFQVGAGRQWKVDLADSNTIAQLRVMNGPDANRPAETAGARAAWLMATNEMSRIPIDVDVDTTSTVAMDAVDYRGQRVSDIWDDLSQATGYNYFTHPVDSGSGDVGLGQWFGPSDGTEHTSIIRLTNDLADIDSESGGFTYAIAEDTELTRDPSRVYSGAYLQYDGGSVYEEDIGTSNQFTRRDSLVPAENVKSAAKATARALRYLHEMSTENDVIKTAVLLPAERVNFIKPGHRIQFKATHLPGYQGLYQWLRVLNLQVRQELEEHYLLTMELGAPVPAQTIIPVGGGVFYGGQDNSWEVYINGVRITVPDNHDADDNDIPIAVPNGILADGDNVIAVKITNGVEPFGWSVGNETYVELRIFDEVENLIAYSTTAMKVHWVSWMGEDGLTFTNVGGEPSGWETVEFDASGWDSAVDVTGTTPNISDAPPVSPARKVSLDDLSTGRFARGAVWLARLEFTL